MSIERAGDYYLNGACRQGKAFDRFVRVVWHGQEKGISMRELRRRLPQIKKESALRSSNLEVVEPPVQPSERLAVVGELTRQQVGERQRGGLRSA